MWSTHFTFFMPLANLCGKFYRNSIDTTYLVRYFPCLGTCVFQLLCFFFFERAILYTSQMRKSISMKIFVQIFQKMISSNYFTTSKGRNKFIWLVVYHQIVLLKDCRFITPSAVLTCLISLQPGSHWIDLTQPSYPT